MAEMTAKQAIAVLHNNQYQKHLGNGEYDYIHPLTDAECKGIESLIQQQQQQIEQLAAEIERLHICATCKYWIKLSNGCENMAGPVIKNRLDKCNNWDVAEQND